MNTGVKSKKAKPIDFARMSRELALETAKTSQDLAKAMRKTASTWDNKPVVNAESYNKDGVYTARAFTTDERYGWIVRGTGERYREGGGEKYPIVPVRAKALAFSSIFSPKSRPGVLEGMPGVIGAVDTFRQGVMHPGVWPRNFDRDLTKMWESKFFNRMSAVVDRVIRASGHSRRK